MPKRFPLSACATPRFILCKKNGTLSIFAHHCPFASQYKYHWRCYPRAQWLFLRRIIFPGKGIFYIHTPIITGSDCEGAGKMFRVTTLDLENLPKGKSGKVDFSPRFLRPGNLFDSIGSAQRRNLRLRHV